MQIKYAIYMNCAIMCRSFSVTGLPTAGVFALVMHSFRNSFADSAWNPKTHYCQEN